jgi:hypothetical protein
MTSLRPGASGPDLCTGGPVHRPDRIVAILRDYLSELMSRCSLIVALYERAGNFARMPGFQTGV